MRNKYNNVNRRPFDRNYWGGQYNRINNNPHWRWHASWGGYSANWCWRPCSWATAGTWFAWNLATPRVYNYGTNVVYRDNYIYVDGEQYATSEAYYDQAAVIAESIPADVEAEEVEWMPMGVYAIAAEDATDSGMMIQLAVSKEGIMAGTLFNDTTDSSRPVEGMVDRDSQRVAIKFSDGKNEDFVMETGLANLTEEESNCMVHFGADRTETWMMVRMPEPDE